MPGCRALLLLLLLFRCLVMSNSLRPNGLQHASLLCPPLSLGICLNSCPLSRWCHLIISSSAIRFSLCLQSFPASGSFPVSRFFTSGGQRIGASASVLPMNIQDWLPLELTGLTSLQSEALSRDFSSTTIWKHHSLVLSLLYGPTPMSVHDYLEKHSFYYMDLCQQSDVSALNMLSRSVITFLPRSKHLLISWQQSQSTVIGAQEKKICHYSHFSCFDLPWCDGTGCYDLSFMNVEFQARFFTLLFYPHQEAL